MYLFVVFVFLFYMIVVIVNDYDWVIVIVMIIILVVLIIGKWENKIGFKRMIDLIDCGLVIWFLGWLFFGNVLFFFSF